MRSVTGCFCRACRARSIRFIAPDDPRRGRAYNVYYVGINIGGFLGALVCGTLGEFYGWHWGFGAAGVGMLAGLMIYVLGGKYLPEPAASRQPTPARAEEIAGHYRSTFLLLGADRSCSHCISRSLRADRQYRGAVGRQRYRSYDRRDDDSDDVVSVAESVARFRDDAARCSPFGGAEPMRATSSRPCRK